MKKIKQIILLGIIITLSLETKAQWNQIGINIDGEALNDQPGKYNNQAVCDTIINDLSKICK